MEVVRERWGEPLAWTQPMPFSPDHDDKLWWYAWADAARMLGLGGSTEEEALVAALEAASIVRLPTLHLEEEV
jgi:hypothetical protein